MSKMGNATKSFFLNLGIDYATGIIRGWLNERLKDITPGDLHSYILQNNDLWADIPLNIKDSAKKFKNKYGGLFNSFQDRITTDLVLHWMKEDWSMLFSTIINTPNGVAWFDGQVQRIKRQIIEM